MFWSVIPVFGQETRESTQLIKHEGQIKEGGELVMGIWNIHTPVLFSRMYDSGNQGEIATNLMNEGLFSYDDDLKITNEGFAEIEFNSEEKTVVITIPKNQKWDDGKPITIDDVIFTYYVIGHPKYRGSLYNDAIRNVKGMQAYKDFETERIDGLEKINDYKLKVTFNHFNSSIYFYGGVPDYIEPKHYLEDIPVHELAKSDELLKKPVGMGPFKVDSLAPDGTIKYIANENYWRGKPLYQRITIRPIGIKQIQNKQDIERYDIVRIPEYLYDSQLFSNKFTKATVKHSTYSYIGLKQGYWQRDEESIVNQSERVGSNRALRQAIDAAIDREDINQTFLNGQAHSVDQFLYFSDNKDDENKKEKDKKNAREILKEAGFVDQNGDGYVETPDGKPLLLNFIMGDHFPNGMILAQYIIETLKDVGINVEIKDGQLIKYGDLRQMLFDNKSQYDLLLYTSEFSKDPYPTSYYSPNNFLNLSAWNTPENEEFNRQWREMTKGNEEVAKAWNQYLEQELPVIPLFYEEETVLVSQTVSQYHPEVKQTHDWTKIGRVATTSE